MKIPIEIEIDVESVKTEDNPPFATGKELEEALAKARSK